MPIQLPFTLSGQADNTDFASVLVGGVGPLKVLTDAPAPSGSSANGPWITANCILAGHGSFTGANVFLRGDDGITNPFPNPTYQTGLFQGGRLTLAFGTVFVDSVAQDLQMMWPALPVFRVVDDIFPGRAGLTANAGLYTIGDGHSYKYGGPPVASNRFS
jgi:hypothetical protein